MVSGVSDVPFLRSYFPEQYVEMPYCCLPDASYLDRRNSLSFLDSSDIFQRENVIRTQPDIYVNENPRGDRSSRTSYQGAPQFSIVERSQLTRTTPTLLETSIPCMTEAEDRHLEFQEKDASSKGAPSTDGSQEMSEDQVPLNVPEGQMQFAGQGQELCDDLSSKPEEHSCSESTSNTETQPVTLVDPSSAAVSLAKDIDQVFTQDRNTFLEQRSHEVDAPQGSIAQDVISSTAHTPDNLPQEVNFTNQDIITQMAAQDTDDPKGIDTATHDEILHQETPMTNEAGSSPLGQDQENPCTPLNQDIQTPLSQEQLGTPLARDQTQDAQESNDIHDNPSTPMTQDTNASTPLTHDLNTSSSTLDRSDFDTGSAGSPIDGACYISVDSPLDKQTTDIPLMDSGCQDNSMSERSYHELTHVPFR